MDIYDLLVVGAGPAGLTAAISAGKFGAGVAVLDENNLPGGQLIKQTHKFFGSKECRAGVRGITIGKTLLADARDTGCEVRLGTRVHSIQKENGLFVVGCTAEGSSVLLSARAVVLATGASENALAFQGWTLPGVMTAGAVQTMVNIHRVLPGRRLLMVGSGNVGLIVAYQMLQAGMEVAGIVEALPAIGGYEVHAAKLRRAGVPIWLSHTIVSANGTDSVTSATICEVDCSFKPIAGTAKSIEADTVCVAVGLSPLYQLARLAGAKVVVNRKKGGFVPECDENGNTTEAGLFVAGDLTGIEEASIAMEEGRLAGLSAAEYLGLAASEDILNVRQASLGNLSALRMEEEQVEPVSGEDISSGEPVTVEKKGNPNVQVIVECTRQIPCNPCDEVCPTGAICVGTPIYNTPQVRQELCAGCCRCVEACPGLACFVVDYGFSETGASVAFAHEFLPLPEKGSEVAAVDKNGSYVCDGQVISVRMGKEKTPVVKILVPKALAPDVRGIDFRRVGGGCHE